MEVVMVNSVSDYTDDPWNLAYRAKRLLLPGLILLVLGLGNLAVGTFKKAEYERELAKLVTLSPLVEAKKLTPLARLALMKTEAISDQPNPLIDAHAKATQRKQFYQLITYGGKLLLGISLLFLGVSGTLQLLRLWRG